MTLAVRAVRWPEAGTAELVNEEDSSDAAAGHALVELAVTVCNPGTERARFTRLPNATVGFPHLPGCGGVGRVRVGAPSGFKVGDIAAVRAAPHRSVVAAAPPHLHA